MSRDCGSQNGDGDEDGDDDDCDDDGADDEDEGEDPNDDDDDCVAVFDGGEDDTVTLNTCLHSPHPCLSVLPAWAEIGLSKWGVVGT